MSYGRAVLPNENRFRVKAKEEVIVRERRRRGMETEFRDDLETALGY